ncbi:MAG: CNNM domain-containing protein, partial [Spirochaetota bacterium]
MTGLLLLAGLLALSGFFSGVETAYTSLSPTQLHGLTNHWPKQGLRVQKLIQRPDRLLSTILIGNNLVNIAAASLATVLATAQFGEAGPGFATGILTIFVLIFGEVTPKQIAIVHNERIACYTALLISILEMVFLPLVLFVSYISNTFSRLSGGGNRQRTPT